jgi:uncharacterized phage protein (predicted DNA packaging)
MTAYIDLDLIKTHLNIDQDYCDEDEYLLTLADVAVRSIANHIDQPIENFLEDGQLDAPLQHAALLLIGTLYQNRESVTYGQCVPVPHGYEYLLHPYICYESRIV